MAQLHRTVDAAASDAVAARHLAAARFDQVDQRFDRLERHADNGFAGMRARFDQTAAGMTQIVELLANRADQ